MPEDLKEQGLSETGLSPKRRLPSPEPACSSLPAVLNENDESHENEHEETNESQPDKEDHSEAFSAPVMGMFSCPHSVGGKVTRIFVGKTLEPQDESDNDNDDENQGESSPDLLHASFDSSDERENMEESDSSSEEEMDDDESSIEQFLGETEEAYMSDDNQVGLDISDDESSSGASNDDTDSEDDSDEDDDNLVIFVSGKTAVSKINTHLLRPTPVIKRSSKGVAVCDDERHDDESIASKDSSSSISSKEGSGNNEVGEGRGIIFTLDENVSDEESISSSDSSSCAGNSDDSEEEESLISEDTTDDESDLDSQAEENLQEREELEFPAQVGTSTIEVELQRALDDDDEDTGDAEDDASSFIGEQSDLEVLKESNCTHEPRESLKNDSKFMEELEDIINDQSSSSCHSDLEFSENEEETADMDGCLSSSLNEEISGLLSDTLEFDFWNRDTISAAVAALAAVSKDCQEDLRYSRYPVRLPKSDDDLFWVDQMLSDIAPESPALKYIVSHPERRVSASKFIYNAFHAELSSLDLTHLNLCQANTNFPPSTDDVHRHLFVGSFSAAKSRLALAALHIKRVIFISIHPLDELWIRDGVKYSSHILPSCNESGSRSTYKDIASAAEEIHTAFCSKSIPECSDSVLVACSTGNGHSCAACALYLMQTSGLNKEAAIAQMCKLHPSTVINSNWLELPVAAVATSPENQASEVTPDNGAFTKAKRALSCQMMADLENLLQDPSNTESPKRIRWDTPTKPTNDCRNAMFLPSLPVFSLSTTADGSEDNNPSSLSLRGSERVDSSSSEEVEYDHQLSEELQGKLSSQLIESDLVPLLTPPSSPRSNGEESACEWESNLTVENAMASTLELRPLSPKLLKRQDENKEEIVRSHNLKGKREKTHTPPLPGTLPNIETGLTPKLQTIRVTYR